MAKKITAKSLIKSATDLVTSRQETRAGFIAMALEKNYIAVPYIEEAKALKALASQVKKPKDLFAAVGIYEKAARHRWYEAWLLCIATNETKSRQL